MTLTTVIILALVLSIGPMLIVAVLKGIRPDEEAFYAPFTAVSVGAMIGAALYQTIPPAAWQGVLGSLGIMALAPFPGRRDSVSGLLPASSTPGDPMPYREARALCARYGLDACLLFAVFCARLRLDVAIRALERAVFLGTYGSEPLFKLPIKTLALDALTSTVPDVTGLSPARALDAVRDVPGVGPLKGAFGLQIASGAGSPFGCLDSINQARLGVQPSGSSSRYLAQVHSAGGDDRLWQDWCAFVAARDSGVWGAGWHEAYERVNGAHVAGVSLASAVLDGERRKG